MLTVAPAFNIDDQHQPVLLFCEQLSRLWECTDPGGWTLDLRSCGYLGPDAAALVYATYLRARAAGTPAIVQLPDQPPALSAFCSFSGLSHHLEKGQRPDPDHPQCETVPLCRFFQAQITQAAAITKLIRRHDLISEDDEFYLGACLSEIAQNIEDHAQSSIGGVLCARYMSSKKEVRVAVVDHGMSIPASLSKVLPDKSPHEKLRRVLEGGVTSRSTQRNMGLGLSTMSKIVRNHDGDLTILSGTAFARQRRAQVVADFGTPAFTFPGTAVFFTIHVSIPQQ